MGGPFSATTMTISVPDHLAFCLAPTGATFLDIRRERYFGLPKDLEAAFSMLALSDFQNMPDELTVDRLLALGVVVRSAKPADRFMAGPAQSSFIDRPPERTSPASLASVLTVAAAVLGARAKLHHRTFEDIVRELAEPSVVADDSEALLERAATFLNARRWVPVKPVCLLDSLALRIYLARFQLRPKLVFGVVRNPFVAHCWLQQDGLVLNERLDRVRLHTPILTIP